MSLVGTDDGFFARTAADPCTLTHRERAAAFQEHEDGSVYANGEGLAAVPIFSACAAHVRHDVASAFSSHTHDGGTYIFRQGDRGDSMYCIGEGWGAPIPSPHASQFWQIHTSI